MVRAENQLIYSWKILVLEVHFNISLIKKRKEKYINSIVKLIFRFLILLSKDLHHLF